MCEVEGSLVCIVKNVDAERYEVRDQTEETPKRKGSDSSDDEGSDSDSVFEQEQASSTYLVDKKRGRSITVASKVKLSLTDVQVSEGTLILSAELI